MRKDGPGKKSIKRLKKFIESDEVEIKENMEILHRVLILHVI